MIGGDSPRYGARKDHQIESGVAEFRFRRSGADDESGKMQRALRVVLPGASPTQSQRPVFEGVSPGDIRGHLSLEIDRVSRCTNNLQGVESKVTLPFGSLSSAEPLGWPSWCVRHLSASWASFSFVKGPLWAVWV